MLSVSTLEPAMSLTVALLAGAGLGALAPGRALYRLLLA